MNYCPSHDWDRYCRDNEGPEECPMCKAPNADDEGDPVCKEAPDFCSVKCSDEYLAAEAARAEGEASWLAEEERVIKEWERMKQEGLDR
jgi:hypothetical protein